MQTSTIADLVRDTRAGTLSPAALVEDFLDAAENHAHLNAFISISADKLRRDAQNLTSRQETSPLYGVPIAIKDLIDIAGETTTAASKLLATNIAKRDAEVIQRLRHSGALLAGKTNLHEFAYGGSGMISAYGPVRNPWNPSRITGGSSSGSASAVAAGMCPAAIGTDTAGSIRLPASFCGIVGFKPTYAAVSAEGIVPLAQSYDHVGPMTRSVEDARILYMVLTGASDHATAPAALRVGIPENYFYRDLDPEVSRAMSDVFAALERAGHTLKKVDFAIDEDRTLASYESYTYHAKWVKESPELYQPETLRRILTGSKVTSEAAAEAKTRLERTRQEAATLFADIDVMLTPTVPILSPAIDDLLAHPETLRPREMIMLRNTRPFNVLGTPAISVPWDLSSDGMPIGIQLVAAPRKDFELLAIAEQLEKITPGKNRTAQP
jgi:Asp-tRNA(Asn)/Glu-tRNA(Gln) amidotransferase A subunit family amidase